jgi:hypothetical protein
MKGINNYSFNWDELEWIARIAKFQFNLQAGLLYSKIIAV